MLSQNRCILCLVGMPYGNRRQEKTGKLWKDEDTVTALESANKKALIVAQREFPLTHSMVMAFALAIALRGLARVVISTLNWVQGNIGGPASPELRLRKVD